MTNVNKSEKAWVVQARSQGEPVEFKADFVVFADGRFSIPFRNQKSQKSGWYGWNARFKNIKQHPGDLSLHFFPNGYVGLLTFSDQTTNVSGLIYRRKQGDLSWERIMEEALFKQSFLKKILSSGSRISSWKGVGPLPYTFGMRKNETHLLAGDAAGTGDPFFGEGIGRALGAGPMLARLFSENPLDLTDRINAYEKLWKKSYAARFHFGFLARLAIQNPFLYYPVLTLLLGPQSITQKLTDTFHQGFTSSSSLFDKNFVS